MCVILNGIFYPSGTLHHTHFETRITTKQVMVLESSLKIFDLAKSLSTINAIVNQGGTITDILSYVVSHGRFVKIQIQHAYQI